MRKRRSLRKEPVPPAPKRCACGLVKVVGQRCLHGAERDPKAQRAADREAKRRQHAARIESERVHLSPDEERTLNSKLSAVDPLFAQAHRVANKAAVRRHGFRR